MNKENLNLKLLWAGGRNKERLTRGEKKNCQCLAVMNATLGPSRFSTAARVQG